MRNRILKGIALQRIGWILTVLIALVWLASEIPLQNASSNDQPSVQTSWRRTVDGWEDSNQWCFYTITREPGLHPFYLGMIQCAAVAWIVFFCYVAKYCFVANPNRPQHIDKNVSLLEDNPNAN